jgi:ribosomal protein S18 acetylase RimI-like enzyme
MDHPTFSIRLATQADAGSILDCLRSAFAAYELSYSAEAYADTVMTLDTLARRLEAMLVLVATSESGEIVGTVGCSLVSAEEGHLRGMAVRPEWQGRGVAGRLLDHVETELRERKCSRISLDTTESLQRAISFYEKRGFRRSGLVADFFGMPLFGYIKTL